MRDEDFEPYLRGRVEVMAHHARRLALAVMQRCDGEHDRGVGCGEDCGIARELLDEHPSLWTRCSLLLATDLLDMER